MKFCKKCGGVDFYACGSCKPCSIKSALARYYRTKPIRTKPTNEEQQRKRSIQKEKLRIASSIWYANNKERRREYEATPQRKAKTAAWYEANRDKAKSYVSEWKKLNPEAKKRHSNNRRARKLSAGGVLSKGLAEKLFVLQRGLCPCCKKPLEEDYHLDHVMPLALGGSNTDDNMQLLRRHCNIKKNAKHPIDFMQSKGYLL